jgi:hypothetical protein
MNLMNLKHVKGNDLLVTVIPRFNVSCSHNEALSTAFIIQTKHYKLLNVQKKVTAAYFKILFQCFPAQRFTNILLIKFCCKKNVKYV